MLEQRKIFEGKETRCIMIGILKEDKVTTTYYERHEGTRRREDEYAPRSVIMTNHGSGAYFEVAIADTAEVLESATESLSAQNLLHDGYLRHDNSMWSLRYSDSQVQMSFMPITIVRIRPFQLQHRHADCSKLFDRMLPISPKQPRRSIQSYH